MNTCDGCPQRAQVMSLTPAGPLLLCQHHGSQAAAKGYPTSPVQAGPLLYPPRGWEACGYGLPVNGPVCGPDRHHYGREDWAS